MALSLRNISHSFADKQVLCHVDIAAGSGELVCILGPSGCGKTTALRLAAGLEQLQSGTVEINGRTVADSRFSCPPEERGVGLVFQDYALFPHLNVAENVAFGLKRSNPDSKSRVAEILGQVGMSAYLSAFPHQLSGGQQQRVALARALAPSPRVMLLDEPFSGLDVALRAALRDTTLHVLKETGVATLMVTHDPEEAMFMADQIILMQDGQVMQAGVPEALYFRPANRFVAGFFGEMNRFAGAVRSGHVVTPFGEVRAGDLADGTEVDVLIRPEALLLSQEAGAKAAAIVIAARPLGRSSLIHLRSAPFAGRELHLHARVPGQFRPPANSRVGVSLDPVQVFVFPKDS